LFSSRKKLCTFKVFRKIYPILHMEAIQDKSVVYEGKIACYEYCVSDDEASASKKALGSFKISEALFCCLLCNMEVYLV
jgi:hypothetical protein